MAVPFVGAGHIELVDELVGRFEEVCEARVPSWWSLEANTGWGKTRVVQEFYARLAARQPEPRYWPPSILTAEQGEVKVERKVVHPPLSPAPVGATPSWFWWGIACSLRHGTPLNALVHDLSRFQERSGALEARFREVASPTTRLKHAYSEHKGELAETAIGEVLSGGATAVGFAYPGLGLLVLLGKWGLQRYRRARDSDDADVVAADVVGEVAPALERFASVGIPLLIVIEDLHEADKVLVELLARVMAAKSAPVFVVTTSWRGALDEHDRPAHALLERVAEDRRDRVLCEQEIADLSIQDLGVIIDAVLPGVDRQARDRLAERFPNPYALQLACQTRVVQRGAAAGAIPDEVLEQLPREVDDLFRQLWEELPEPVRRTLIIAGQLAPGTVSARLGLGDLRWDPELLNAVVERLQWLAADLPEIARHIQDADEAYAWVRVVDEWLQRFNDPVQHRIAADAITDEYLPDEQQEMHSAAAAEAASAAAAAGMERGSSPERATNRDRLLVALAAEGYVEWDEYSAKAAARICSSLLQLKGTAELSIAIEICTRALDNPTTLDFPAAAPLCGIRASCLGQSGKVKEAIEQFQRLLEDQTGELGADAPATLQTRGNLAHWLGKSGQVNDAVEQFQRLLEEQTNVPGANPLDALTTRNNLAGWLSEAGQVKEAIRQFQVLLEDQTKVLGDDASDTLGTRNNLASLLGEDGQVKEAVEQLRRLLGDQTRVLGADAPDTLTTRGNLAYWLGEAGQVNEATGQFQVLLEDQTRVLGADAPATLQTRGTLARSLGEAGQVEEAVKQFRRLLGDQTRVLGADAPDTLTTRGNLAYWLGKAGQVDEAIRQFQRLLDEETRVLGAGAPATLQTRGTLAHWLGEAGRVEEAIGQFQVLLELQTNVLDADAPATLQTRGNLARWLGEAGQVKAAIEQFQRLLEQQTRVLGAGAPDTLTTRDYLATLFGLDGRVKEAIGQFQVLLEEETRVFGADAPRTLTTRNNLAFFLGRDGRVKEAIEQFRVLLGDQTRVFGADAPGTLRIRGNLARCLGEAGQVKDAIEGFQVLLGDQTRVLGADAPDTLKTRNYLARCLGEAGQVKKAIGQLQVLLEEQTRVLGAEAPATLQTRGNLAGCLAADGQVKEAIDQFRRLLEEQTRVLGADAPDTLTTRNKLAHLDA